MLPPRLVTSPQPSVTGTPLLMGAITGVAGGVLRDGLTAQIPLVLRPGRLYAMAAIVGGALYLLAEGSGAAKDAAALAGMVAIVGLRLAAILWGSSSPWSVCRKTNPADATCSETLGKGRDNGAAHV